MGKRSQFVLSQRMLETLVDIHIHNRTASRKGRARWYSYDSRTLNALMRRDLITVDKRTNVHHRYIVITSAGLKFANELRTYFRGQV